MTGVPDTHTAGEETDEQFLALIRRIAEDWRYSDEFLGIIVRTRYPADYRTAAAEHSAALRVVDGKEKT